MGGGTALTNTAGPVQGMIDQLRPDFNNTSTQFQAAAFNPNNFASSISGLAESMLTRPTATATISSATAANAMQQPSPDDSQLRAVLQESVAYAASASCTFEEDTRAALQESVLGPTAPDVIGVYNDNDPEFWDETFKPRTEHERNNMSGKTPASVASSLSSHPSLSYSAKTKPGGGMADFYNRAHPAPAPAPKKRSATDRTDEFVSLVSNVAAARYEASLFDGTPGAQDTALELMDTLAGNGDNTALTMIRSKATIATPAAGEEEKAADFATKMINHRKKRQQKS